MLSLQLPLAVLPLVRFESDPRMMGRRRVRCVPLVLSWLALACIVRLDGAVILSGLRIPRSSSTPVVRAACIPRARDPDRLTYRTASAFRPRFSMASNLHDLPDSPCIGVCSTLFDEICKGCGRTATEVSNWVFLSDEEKRVVWERIKREGTAMRFQNDHL